MEFLPVVSICWTIGAVPGRIPTSLTSQLATAVGLICVGERNGAVLDPSLTTVGPTVMSPISRPPSSTPPSLT